MTAPVVDITITKGKTFEFSYRYADDELVYKPISAMPSTAPVRLTVTAHGIPRLPSIRRQSMNQRIVFQLPGQPVAILTPCECGLSIEAIGRKDVPAGVPFWIVPRADIDALYAEQGEWRDAWVISQDAIGRAPDGVGEA